jgi:hypothetical protein
MCIIVRENTTFGFKICYCVLLEKVTHAPENVAETDLMFVLIKTCI